jgi:hypothetical protein
LAWSSVAMPVSDLLRASLEEAYTILAYEDTTLSASC